VQRNVKSFPTLSKMLNRYYFGKAERDRVKQQSNDLERFIVNERDKNKKKIKKRERSLSEAENAEQYQLLGELLTANLYAVKKGLSEVEVINYYDEESKTVKIPLIQELWPYEKYKKNFTKKKKTLSPGA
ncbi:NFACT family protein, partial [Streptococcus hyovaginalis]